MKKADVIYNRNLIQSLTYDVKNEDGSTSTMKTPIVVYGTANVNVITDYQDGSFVWNDDKETIFFFNWNNQVEMNAPAPAMSLGAAVKAPCYVGFMPYSEIVSMKAVLIQETFDKICSSIGVSGAAKDYLFNKFFVETNQEYQIKKKKELKISYSNQHTAAHNSDKYFSEMDEYKKTVHPSIL